MSRRLLLILLALPFLLGAVGCRRTYSQASPEDVLASAKAMIENGDAHRLPDLLYAQTPELRRLMTKFGTVLGSLQSLALDLHRTYPDEIAEIKRQAEEAAARGETTGLVGRLLNQGNQPARPRGRRDRGSVNISAGPGGAQMGAQGPGAEGMQQSLNQMAKELFADPYGWLARSEGRITIQKQADNLAAILWDGKPAFGFGLLMIEDGGKWYLSLPPTVPGMGRIAPGSEETWQIAEALAVALNNAIKDTQREVRAGQHPTLEDLSRSVGEKAAIPAIAIMYAYQRVMRLERQEQRDRERQEREAREPASAPSPGAG